MSGKKVIFYILGAFITGALVLAYVEYLSTTQVHALVTANQKLMGEFQITKKLLDGAKSKVVVERKIRGFIESRDTSYLSGLNDEFNEIASADSFLLTIADDSTTIMLTHELDRVMQLKVNLFHKILAAYHLHGIQAAEDSINGNLSEWVAYDIENTIRKITETRRNQLSAITGSIQKSGQKALEFGYILISLVLVAAALTLWYIIFIIQKLTRSEKKVKEVARVKENFLANMSHEIRTPMNAILGFTELLSQKPLDEDAKHYVDMIQRSGENLLAIVNDILDISKIEAGMMRIERVAFSLRGLMSSVETMMMARAQSRGIKLVSETDPSIPDVLEGDPVRLTQILTNLLSNAIKFTEQGSVFLNIGSLESNSNTTKLKIEVKDTGIGIEAKKLDHVFGRFQQADETITRQFGGTGLGLSIVKDLVDLQHGTIDVDSEPGKGTRFTIVIPYAVASEQNKEGLLNYARRSPSQWALDIRVLVAEDNEFNQSLLTHIFNNWHIGFDLAANGMEAIEKLQANRYDVVLMDIQMPLMDGYTTARKIRNELKSNIPVIAMTAHALPGEKEKCLSNGMNDYIAKPVKQVELARMIARFTSFNETTPVPDTGNDQAAPRNEAPYQYLRLQYMKEISAGDLEYEKDVTEKFLKLVPLAIDELEECFKEGDRLRLAQTAHNLKTTISIMGLNDQLNPLLDIMESPYAEPNLLQQTIYRVKEIAFAAVAEADEFRRSLG